MRYLQRTHIVSIGVLHDLTTDPDIIVIVLHVSTEPQKANIYTKALKPEANQRAVMMLGMEAG